jgi:hypothetical protein
VHIPRHARIARGAINRSTSGVTSPLQGAPLPDGNWCIGAISIFQVTFRSRGGYLDRTCRGGQPHLLPCAHTKPEPLSISFKKSTSPQNRQLMVSINDS